LALSDQPPARFARALYRGLRDFSVPAPRFLARPTLAGFVLLRAVYYFAWRVFICEPLFKAYCTKYGRGVHTDIYIHWIQGRGDLILGDDVLVDGKCGITFGSRFGGRPALTIGDHSGIGHGCSFTVGKGITIGRHCRVGRGVVMFDSSGHPSDPARRQAGAPPTADDVRPIVIRDNVWIGVNSLIFPGVTIGEGSVVSAGSVVTGDVPPYTVVAGNPARKVAALPQAPKEQPQVVSC
jgi:acetyltransferase-like isoleucine patch superfamily enzyme